VSFGRVEPGDLMCPNGCGPLHDKIDQLAKVCYQCGWYIPDRDIQIHKVRDLRQMIKDKVLGMQFPIGVPPEGVMSAPVLTDLQFDGVRVSALVDGVRVSGTVNDLSAARDTPRLRANLIVQAERRA
jgi:hypothetical protein